MPVRDGRVARRQMYRRRRLVAGGGLLLCCTLLVMAGFKVADAFPDRKLAVSASNSSVPAVGSLVPDPAETAPPSSSPTSPTPATSSPAAVSPRSTAPPTPTMSPSPVVVRATGVYARATGSTARQGPGTVRTYRVEVETGTGQSAPAFAAEVDSTLANPASWGGQGTWSLQRVAGDNADFVIRLATPATVDRVCASAGLDTRGYVSCRAGNDVMINLDRWMTAVPEYRGDVVLYRKYVINHEVGHQLGYGHQSCPRPGALAPVMQQQTFGLNGCRPNGWPLAAGVLVTGPATR